MPSARAPLEACTSTNLLTRSCPSGLNSAFCASSFLSFLQPIASTVSAAAVAATSNVFRLLVSIRFIVDLTFIVPNPIILDASLLFSSQHAAVHQADYRRPGEHDERGREDEQHEGEAHLDRRLG